MLEQFKLRYQTAKKNLVDNDSTAKDTRSINIFGDKRSTYYYG